MILFLKPLSHAGDIGAVHLNRAPRGASARERLPPDVSAPSGRMIGIRPDVKALASALHLEAELALRQ